MDYLIFDDKTWAVDIETDGLRPTCVWVLCAGNMMTGEKVTLTDPDEIRKWVDDRQAEGCKFVFHNGLHFDAPVLNNLCGTRLSVTCIVDTMLLSSLFNPSLDGGHSLDAWGRRLNYAKVEHEDWSILSPEMIVRCEGDVELTKRVYGYLCRKLNAIGFSEECCEIEHKAWVIIRKQQINGFHFDMDRAISLKAELQEQADKLHEDLMRFFPPKLECVRVYASARNKDGSFSKSYNENLKRYHSLSINLDNTYEAWDYVPFEPGSPPQRVEKLLELGWVPLEFTKKTDKGGGGNPQPTRKGKLSPSLQAFVDAQEEDNGVVTLVDWMMVNSRITMIGTWQNAYNEATGCIHGQLWLANTLRYKHSSPNTANAPAVKEGEEKDAEGKVIRKWPLLARLGGWAYECRDLWSVRDRHRRRLVGVDAKGIQLRVLAHYLNDPAFTSAILSEDPHAANAKLMELPSRGIAKTITYAIVMGAGDARIALEARISEEEAKANKEKFFSKVPGLPKLIKRLKADQKKTGRISLCDGGRIIVDQPHTVIPYLLQGDESRIMKLAKIMVDKLIRKYGLDVLWVGDIHDEWQCDVLEEDVEDFIKLCRVAFKKAGEHFNYNLPIECDAKVGFTWAETH